MKESAGKLSEYLPLSANDRQRSNNWSAIAMKMTRRDAIKAGAGTSASLFFGLKAGLSQKILIDLPGKKEQR